MIPATRFADPTVDFAFKRIFGTEAYKQNTVNLLNAVIPDIGIVDVKFIALLGRAGDWDYRLPPVYVVSVLDFPLGRHGVLFPRASGF